MPSSHVQNTNNMEGHGGMFVLKPTSPLEMCLAMNATQINPKTQNVKEQS